MASITLKDVVKRYGTGPKANRVIHGFSAEIADHEFIVIVGPSGCGKSTLLRMVAGLEEISGGPVSIGGRVVNDVAMGRASVRQPQVFLFDEPLSNLDAKLRAATRLEIQRLHADLGVTSLFVTHDQVEAMTLAQRMIVMNAGRMEQIGTPDEVYHRPATPFVASFIGSPPMNLITGQADGSRFTAGGQTLALPVAAPRGGELALGLRPEHVELSRDGGAGWPLRVEALEMLGAERLVYGRLGEAQFIVRIDATLTAPRVGDTVSLQAAPARLHWFEAASQRRI